MEKQYSEEFFCTFVDNLQKLCRNFLDFEQVCEVSGYVCLMMDNSKQERYVLSEMVHNSGSVISESYCTKAFRTLPLLRNVPHPRKHYEHDFSPEFDEDYDSSMDSCTHSSMDSFSGEVPHGLAISDVQSLSSSHKHPAVAPNLNSRNPSHVTKMKCPEKPRISSNKDIMMKSETHVESDPKNVDKKRTLSPKPQKIIVKQEICEEEEDTYDHSIKPDSATATTHKEPFYPHQRPPVQHGFVQHDANQRIHGIEEGLVQIKQEPEDTDFIPNVEINSNISDLNILKEEFLIAEPIGFLKSKEFTPCTTGPKTKRTPRKVYVPLSTASRPGGNREIQPRKFIKLVQSNPSDEGRVARPCHSPEHLHDDEHPDSDSEDFMYDSNDSMNDSCSDMEDHHSYPSDQMIHGHPDLPLERHHTFPSRHMDKDTSGSQSRPHSLAPSHSEQDSTSLPVEKQQPCASSQKDQVSNLPPDSHSTFAPGRSEKDTASLPVEKQHVFVSSHVEQGTELPSDKHDTASSDSEEESSNLSTDGHHTYVSGHAEQGPDLAPDRQSAVLPGPEKDGPNLSVERQDTYTSSHMEQGIALRVSATSQGEKDNSKLPVERQDAYTSSHMEKSIALRTVTALSSKSEQESPSLTIERQDTYTSSHMEKGIALRTVTASSSKGEQESPNLTIKRQDTYTSSHMEKGIALRTATVSSRGEKDNSKFIERQDTYISSHMEKGIALRAAIALSPNLSIEREDVYTSSHMAKGIAMRAAVMSGHTEKDKPKLPVGRQDTYTSSRMEQGIAMRAAITSGQVEQDPLDSHYMYDPHHRDQVTSTISTESPHQFISSPMEQKLTSLPSDCVKTTASGHVIKAPSSLSNISLMEESGDEIIELDSDDIEEDEGLAAATASLSQHSFSQSQPNEPSTSSQSIVAKEPQRHMQYAINLFTEYHRQQGYSEPMHLIPPQKLDLLLASFYENVKKNKTGEDFTPFSLKNIQNRLQKYLREHNYPYSITSDSAFSKSREILRIKIEELKVKNIPQKVDMVTEEDVEILFQKNQLGACSPDTLFNTMWFINTMFLGIKSRIEHCNLKWGDIVLNIDHTGREFLRYAGPKQSVKNRSKPLYANIDEPDRCFVELYKIYEDRRPPELLMADAPFYGTVIKFPTGEPWFLPEPTPSTRFNGILQKMAKEAGLAPGRKFTNSSCYVK
ncbi:uncharacterized protein LOC121384288 [Gigantopelta aegis]|uniref:uncharacterized protein LOC121384288 n=1 Tax=Gigantopelta aegis TaxID=1735272 RepID=UPI001B88B1A8|nr:uncharacterized protein LOC121384288 [Gigantopelta aegis]